MRRVLLTFFALICAALLGGAWYLSSKGFTRKWRSEVIEEFRSRGIEVTLRRLKLDPLRGMVAQDLRVAALRLSGGLDRLNVCCHVSPQDIGRVL